MNKFLLTSFLFIVFIEVFGKLQPDNTKDSSTISPVQKIDKKDDSKDTLKMVKNAIFKEVLQLTSPQSYLSLPLMDWHFGKYSTYRTYILSTNPNPRFFIGTGANTRLAVEVFMNTIIRINWTDGFSPRYNTKTFWNQSFPVRTPSYNPGLIFHWQLGGSSTKNDMEIKKLLIRNPENNHLYRFKSVSIKLFHHSNGQDAPNSKGVQARYLMNTIDDIKADLVNSNKATPLNVNQVFNNKYPNADTSRYGRDFNIYNGNFGINLGFEIGLSFNKYRYGGHYIPSITDDSIQKYKCFFKNIRNNTKDTSNTHRYFVRKFNYDIIRNTYIGFESGQLSTKLIPNFPLGEESLKGCYGMEKLVYRFTRIQASKWLSPEEIKEFKSPSVFEKDRIVINASLSLNKLNTTKYYYDDFWNRLNIDFKYHMNVFCGRRVNSNSVSFFVGGGWKGQDDYNIYLEDSFFYVQTGIALGFKVHRAKLSEIIEAKIRNPKSKVSSIKNEKIQLLKR